MLINPEIIQEIGEQNNNRKLWVDNDSSEHIEQMFMAEIEELWEAVNQAFVDDDLTNVAFEMGDVFYLAGRHLEKFGKYTPKMLRWLDEVAQMAIEFGVNPEDTIRVKLFRNSYKYADYVMSNGRNYEEAVKVVKDTWKMLVGDVAFSHAYLDVLAHES